MTFGSQGQAQEEVHEDCEVPSAEAGPLPFQEPQPKADPGCL